MFTLLNLIILRNWQSLLTLIGIIIVTGVGFITLGQLTTNIESSVAIETRPIFGADMIISIDSHTGDTLYDTLSPYLSGETYTWTERYEFSTTLFDREGKTGLVKVIAYNGTYPQRGILKTKSLGTPDSTDLVHATQGLLERFASGGMISLDEKNIVITSTIVESSDLGFSFGTDNQLLILPASYLSGSKLLSLGSRLDHELLISFENEKRTKEVKKNLESELAGGQYRIRTFEERTDRALEVVDELSDYILLILTLSSLFALVILRSAHDAFFTSLQHILTIVQILGFNKKRQRILFAILYSTILPISLIIAGYIGYLILGGVTTFPEAGGFEWYFSSFFTSIVLLGLLILAAFFPAWQIQWQNIKSKNQNSILQSNNFLSFFLSITIVSFIFDDIFFASMVVVCAALFIIIFKYIFHWIYERLFEYIKSMRSRNFPLYDGVRTLVRPMMPTFPITLSLITVTTFFLVFFLFSFSFREELTQDMSNSANIYALNILESDREKIEKVLSGSEMYSVLRARISRINNKTLEEHFDTPRPSGEFTREFNITTNKLENTVLQGKEIIAANEVSVDDDFAKRLGVDIGDTIDFLLSGKSISLTIASIRESKRQGFRPFFYFSFEPKAFEKAPKTYFVSTYTQDREGWKRLILENSGPHVTFIDVENILAIVRDVSAKVMTIIWLFLSVVGIFAVFAIISFFIRMKPVETIKIRLYTIFGLIPSLTRTSLNYSRIALLVVSGIFSSLLGCIIAGWIFYSSALLSFSGEGFIVAIIILVIIYVIFALILCQRH